MGKTLRFSNTPVKNAKHRMKGSRNGGVPSDLVFDNLRDVIISSSKELVEAENTGWISRKRSHNCIGEKTVVAELF